MNLGLLASHGGSNAQAVMDACRSRRLAASACVLLSNNSGSGALERARREGIPARHLSSRTHPDPAALDAAIRDELVAHEVELVVLAGYMKKLGPRTLERFEGRIVNTHPALLPRHGGRGMFGDRVHQAVLDAGDSETGITVHLVDGDYDSGPILAQCRVPVLRKDDVESLRRRVQAREHDFLVESLVGIVSGRIGLPKALRLAEAGHGTGL